MPRTYNYYADFSQAIALLRDNQLVWSEDMEVIRHDLADFIQQSMSLGWWTNASLQKLVQKLISEENDLSIGD